MSEKQLAANRANAATPIQPHQTNPFLPHLFARTL
jgi:hypothetical protein